MGYVCVCVCVFVHTHVLACLSACMCVLAERGVASCLGGRSVPFDIYGTLNMIGIIRPGLYI